jgi:hypothetical protein
MVISSFLIVFVVLFVAWVVGFAFHLPLRAGASIDRTHRAVC